MGAEGHCSGLPLLSKGFLVGVGVAVVVVAAVDAGI